MEGRARPGKRGKAAVTRMENTMAIDKNDPEFKTALQAEIDKLDEKHETEIEGLKLKNKELIVEVKKLSKNMTITPEEHQALKDRNAELEEALATSQKTEKSAKAEVEKLTKAVQAETGAMTKMLVDAGLTEALAEAKVKPEFNAAAKALLSGLVTVKVDGDKRVAVVGDKPLKDFVTGWAATDEGKHFVAAPVNTGLQSQGSRDTQQPSKTMTRKAFQALPADKQGEFMKEVNYAPGSIIDE